MYYASDGRRRLITLINASKNNGIPIKLRVFNGLYDKYCEDNGIIPFNRESLFLQEINKSKNKIKSS